MTSEKKEMKNKMSLAVVSLGSNLGDRYKNIDNAIKALNSLHKTKVLSVSEKLETEPVGAPDKQGLYINCCVKLETELEPVTLLGACLGIESAVGRVRSFKNAARIIDIDLLLYDDVVLNTKDLILPHPRMYERDFVMMPLKKIWNL